LSRHGTLDYGSASSLRNSVRRILGKKMERGASPRQRNFLLGTDFGALLMVDA
jgi:hypothetical protein